MDKSISHQSTHKKTARPAKPVSTKHAASVTALLQPKLKIGRQDDPLEREADRVADHVISIPQTEISASGINPSGLAHASHQSPVVQRICASCQRDEELIHTKPGTSTVPATTPSLDASIQSIQGQGHPLHNSQRHYFEPRFAADFSDVRIHNSAQAASVARSINARAFTLGSNIYFATGEYNQQSVSGKRLLAHELTHVVQQKGRPSTIRREEGESEQTDRIDLCFVPIGQFGLGQAGGLHVVLNIHQGSRVTRAEVDPNNHQGIEDPAAAHLGPGRAAGLHSHVVTGHGARRAGTCHSFAVTPTQSSNAVTAVNNYESMDVVYEPPGIGPNSNSFGEWVLHEAGVNTATISVPAGALGWGWYRDNSSARSSPPRVARTFQGTAAGCSQSHGQVSGFRQLVDLVRRIETQLVSCGMTDVGDRLNLMRGVFYGTPWSRDFGTSQQSHARNQMFNVYAGTTQPRNPIECLDCGLFLSLGASQDVTDGRRHVDVGHMIIGMDARRSYLPRTLTQPIGQVTGLEATTWAGDLGGGAARLAMARRTRRAALATEFFRGTDYGGSINLEGDVAAYAVAASGVSTGDAPPLAIPVGSGVADALELYLIGIPASQGTQAQPRGWDSRCSTFLSAMRASFNSSGAISNRSDVHDYLAEQIHDFGCWYMLTYQSNNPLSTPQMVEASRHMEGAANEVAEVFLSALERCHTVPGSPLAAHGAAPSPTAIGSESCHIALAGPQAQQATERALEAGEELLEQVQQRGGEFVDDAEDWIRRRQREAQRWWREQ